MPDSSYDFYRSLKGFSEFSDVTDLSHFHPLPDDWCIVIADITGSTKAIGEGRYKDVNVIGAACITAVINAIPDCEIPYVFGGDGATLAVPSSTTDAVKRVLGATRRLALDQFGLNLRAGIVPVSVVRNAGADVMVAKFQLSHGNAMAMLTGGGVQMVDDLIKADDGTDDYQVDFPEDETSADLEGLSCRWEPLRSCNGTMLNMLVRAMGTSQAENTAIYREVITTVETIVQSQASTANPVSSGNMMLKWPTEGLLIEYKLSAGSPHRIRKFLRIYCTSLIQFFLEKFGLSAGSYDARKYGSELRSNSDYRRFDDTLRMILDCSEGVASEIETFFTELHEKSKIVFGVHKSNHALMTCLVFSLSKGEHVHFIDGSDGGFTMAAVQLKAQMQKAAQRTT